MALHPYLTPWGLFSRNVVHFLAWSGVAWWIHWLPWWVCLIANAGLLIFELKNYHKGEHAGRWWLKSAIDFSTGTAALWLVYSMAR